MEFLSQIVGVIKAYAEYNGVVGMLCIFGTIAVAMSGAIAATRVKMDLVGVIVIALSTAIGGGTIRDVLLGHYPIFWVRQSEFVVICVVAALLAIKLKNFVESQEYAFLVLDALGLAVFAVIGAQVAISMGHDFVIIASSATITAIFGGVLRDIFSNTIPLVFRKELYATIAFGCAVVYYALIAWGVGELAASLIAITLTFVARLLAIKYKLSLNFGKEADE